MIDFGHPPFYKHGHIIFRDHDDQRVRYIAPTTPTLVVKDGEPGIELALFRGNRTGGLLSFEATLSSTDAQKAAISALFAHIDDLLLLTPQWRHGETHLAGWLATDELQPVRQVLTPPSLTGDPLTINTARLDNLGAAMAQQSLLRGGLPTALIFDMQTVALGAPLGVGISANLAALHERFTLKGALRAPMTRLQIQATWEEAVLGNDIVVEVIDESGDTEGHRAEALRRSGEDLITRLFSPHPLREQPPQFDDRPVAAIELSFLLTQRKTTLQREARWSFREWQSMPFHHRVAASLVDIVPGGEASARITRINLHDRSRTLRVLLDSSLSTMGILSIDVSVRQIGQPTDTIDLLLDDTQSDVQIPVDRNWLPDLEYRTRCRYDPLRAIADDVAESAWLAIAGDVLLVSPRRLFPSRTLSVMIGRGELDWIDSVQVTVSGPHLQGRSLVLDESRRSGVLVLDGLRHDQLSLDSEWQGRIGEPSGRTRRTITTESSLIIDSPFASSLSIFIALMPLTDAGTVVIDLEHRGSGAIRRMSLIWDAGDREPRTVALRRLHDAESTYRYRVSLFRQDGGIQRDDWIETDATQLVIGADQAMTVHVVEVILLGRDLAERGAFAAMLTLSAGSETTRGFLEHDASRLRLVLATPAHVTQRTVHVLEHLDIGGVRETTFTDTPSLVVVPMPTELEPEVTRAAR